MGYGPEFAAALRAFLDKTLPNVIDTGTQDQPVLTEYIMALLQRDEPLDQLRSFFIEKLEEFMEKETRNFVDQLMDFLKSEDHLRNNAQPVRTVDEDEEDHRRRRSSPSRKRKHDEGEDRQNRSFADDRRRRRSPERDRSGKQHGRQRKRAVCFEFENKGSCRRGADCQYEHGPPQNMSNLDPERVRMETKVPDPNNMAMANPAAWQNMPMGVQMGWGNQMMQHPQQHQMPMMFHQQQQQLQQQQQAYLAQQMGGPSRLPYQLPSGDIIDTGTLASANEGRHDMQHHPMHSPNSQLPPFSRPQYNHAEDDGANDRINPLSNHESSESKQRGIGRGMGMRMRGEQDEGFRRPPRAQYVPEERQNATNLCVTRIPAEQNNVVALSGHFGRFGEIVNIRISGSLAYIKFKTHDQAKAALESPEAVLNNRFITVQWARREPYEPGAPMRKRNNDEGEDGNTGSSKVVVEKRASTVKSVKESAAAAIAKIAEAKANGLVPSHPALQTDAARAKQKLHQALEAKQRDLSAKLEASTSAEEKTLLKDQLSKLQLQLEAVSKNSSAAPAPSAAPKGVSAATLTQLRKAEVEAAALGFPISGSLPSKPANTKAPWGTPRKPAWSNKMALDNRSGVVKIGNPPPGEVAVTIEAMRKHMMKFGNVQDVSSLPSGGLAVKFGSRREADVALERGKIFGSTHLDLSIIETETPVKAPRNITIKPAGSAPSVEVQTPSDTALEGIEMAPEDEESEEEEEDQEERAWKR